MVSFSGSVQVRMRSYFSRYHILAAAQFSRMSLDLEHNTDYVPLPGDEKQRIFDEHRGAVIGAVICSTSFLEAVINEAFADASESYLTHLGCITKETAEGLGSIWRGSPESRPIERIPIVEKFDRFLEGAGLEKIDRRSPVYSNARCLITLRNAVVHYVPVWRPAAVDPDPSDEWVSRLRGKFAENPFTGAGNPFPRQVLESWVCSMGNLECAHLRGLILRSVRWEAALRIYPPRD